MYPFPLSANLCRKKHKLVCPRKDDDTHQLAMNTIIRQMEMEIAGTMNMQVRIGEKKKDKWVIRSPHKLSFVLLC